MVASAEIDHLSCQIARTEARLLYQRAAVRRLGAGADPRFARIAIESLAVLENRLTALRVERAGLLEQAAPALCATTRAERGIA